MHVHLEVSMKISANRNFNKLKFQIRIDKTACLASFYYIYIYVYIYIYMYICMYQLILLHSCDYLQKTSIKINVATDKGKQPKWNMTLNKRWNWRSYTKLALSASWTHGLVAQSVRASERNSLVVGPNPTQANFL